MKEIQLTQGKVALVDDEDFERVNQFKWYAHNSGYTFRAVRNIRIDGKRKTQTLHGFIMGDNPKCLDIDHVNCESLDCQKHNIRFCTQSQNDANRRPFKKGTSKYKGVSWVPNYGKFVARIQKDGLLQRLGYFEDEVEAAKAYDRKAKELFGEFARVNFPENFAGHEVILKIGDKTFRAIACTNIDIFKPSHDLKEDAEFIAEAFKRKLRGEKEPINHKSQSINNTSETTRINKFSGFEEPKPFNRFG